MEDIANEYKQELEKISISDDDIESLHQTVETTFNIIMNAGIIDYTSDEDQVTTTQSLKALLALLNSDTLRTLQLLGYNYKDAIGAPLTEATSNFILNKLSPEPIKPKQRRK